LWLNVGLVAQWVEGIVDSWATAHSNRPELQVDDVVIIDLSCHSEPGHTKLRELNLDPPFETVVNRALVRERYGYGKGVG
jgi:hypothetical protein